MAAQVGEAFVRIRPNMTSFKSETETGVKSSFSSLAKIAGLAFGGAAIGSFIKNSIESAGQSQAITQSVREEFGKTGKAILDFAKNQGAAFGSTETATNQASFALGKLFRNTGDSARQAAFMTTNWEKLALALNQAKGGGIAGAAQALQVLQTVATGTSTRGLHELGVTITSGQIQAQALRDRFLALGQSVSVLTPAQKQLVTFQLAMRTLPSALDQARAHSHDFASEQARLGVAWDNARTALGKALLPEITKGTTALANWLTKMERSGRLQADFNTAAHITASVFGAIKSVLTGLVHIWDSFAKAVGGSKNALYGLIGAFAAFKGLSLSRSIGTAIQGDEQGLVARIRGHIANIKAAQAAASGVGGGALNAALTAKQVAANGALQASLGKVKTSQDALASSTKTSTASVEAGIQRFRAALFSGQPLPKSDAYIKALQAQARNTGPFSSGWVQEQKAHISSVADSLRAATSQVGPTAAGAASIDAGIQRFRKDLLTGQKVPKSDNYFKALVAQAKVSGTAISGSLGKASEITRQKIKGIGEAFAPVAAKAQSASQTTVGHIEKMQTAFSGFATTAKSQASSFAGSVSSASSRAGAAFGAAATGMKIAAIEVGATIKVAIIQTGIGLLVVAIGIAVGYIITHWDTVKRYTLALARATEEAFKGMGQIVVGVYQYIYGKALYYIVDFAKYALDLLARAVGWIPFIGGKVSAAAHAVDSFAGSLHRLAEGGRQRILSGFNDIAHGVTKAWSDSLKQTANDPKVKDAANKAGKTVGKGLLDGAQGAITQTVPSVQKAISDALQNAVAAAHKAIENAVQSAKNNLDKIGQDLANTISNIQSKIGGAAGAIAGSPQGKAFEKLKKLIESGAPAFQIQKAQAELAGQLQNVGKTQKQQVSTQLADLTAAFDKGQIGYREFESRLHKILHDDGITMKEALKAGGAAFADAFKAQVRALGAQARAIAALPAKYRGIGGAGGAADIKIIQPLQVIKQEQLKVRTAVERAAREAQKQRAAQLKAQQKTAGYAQQLATVGVKLITKTSGRPPAGDRHHQSALLGQVRDHTRRAADTLTRKTPKNYVTAAQVAAMQARVNRLLAAFEDAQQHSSSRTTTLQRQLRVAQEQLRVLKQEQASQSQARSTSRPRPSGPSPIKQAVTTGTAALLRGLREVCSDITQADKDIVAAELGLHSPLENLRRTELRIGDNAAKQRQHQIRLQSETNTLLRRLDRRKGPVPGFNKERPGTGGHHARNAAAAGVKT